MALKFADIDGALHALQSVGYIANRDVATACFLMDALEKPLLVEGPSGVGKTALAKALSLALTRPLVRLQCYEGLDESRALYEWDYPKQLLYADLLKPTLNSLLAGTTELAEGVARLTSQHSALFDPRFLLERPLLAALRADPPAMLLIDEVDRADPEFEALLLEVLSDFQVSIPELGSIRATHKPRVVLTSNGTREMTDALRRRCLYLHLDYPEASRELAIVQARVPEATQTLAKQVVEFVQRARSLDLKQAPSIAETLDWARALLLLSADTLDAAFVRDSLGALAKQASDLRALHSLLDELHPS